MNVFEDDIMPLWKYNGTRFQDGHPQQQVSNGHYVDILSPQPEQIHIEDIAISLSRQPRYMGHTNPVVPYSVAQHCCFVSEMVEKDGYPQYLQRWGFMHDWSEFVMGDLSSPMKRTMELLLGNTQFKESWGAVEEGLDEAIRRRFGVPQMLIEEAVLIKYYDYVALSTEKRDLMLTEGPWGPLPEPRDDFKIVPWSTFFAYSRFKERFVELFGTELWEATK